MLVKVQHPLKLALRFVVVDGNPGDRKELVALVQVRFVLPSGVVVV